MWAYTFGLSIHWNIGLYSTCILHNIILQRYFCELTLLLSICIIKLNHHIHCSCFFLKKNTPKKYIASFDEETFSWEVWMFTV